MKQMQHCFFCGEELGVFDGWTDDILHCSKQECSREAQYELQAREADARDRAADDNYDRYR